MRSSPSKSPLRHVFHSIPPLPKTSSRLQSRVNAREMAPSACSFIDSETRPPPSSLDLHRNSLSAAPSRRNPLETDNSHSKLTVKNTGNDAKNASKGALGPWEIPTLREVYRKIRREHEELKAKIAHQQRWIARLVSDRLPGVYSEAYSLHRKALSSALHEETTKNPHENDYSVLSFDKNSSKITIPSTPSPKDKNHGHTRESRHVRGFSVPRQRKFPKEVFPMNFKRR